MRTDDADDVADGVGVHHLPGRASSSSLANGRNCYDHRDRE